MVRVEDFYAGMPGSKLPRHSGIFFLKNSRDLHFDNNLLSRNQGRFPFTKNFGKFLVGIPGISVWEESVPFVTSPIRLQAPPSLHQKTRCLGKLLCYFLERVFVRRFPVKQMVIIGMYGYEKSGICMFPSF